MKPSYSIVVHRPKSVVTVTTVPSIQSCPDMLLSYSRCLNRGLWLSVSLVLVLTLSQEMWEDELTGRHEQAELTWVEPRVHWDQDPVPVWTPTVKVSQNAVASSGLPSIARRQLLWLQLAGGVVVGAYWNEVSSSCNIETPQVKYLTGGTWHEQARLAWSAPWVHWAEKVGPTVATTAVV